VLGSVVLGSVVLGSLVLGCSAAVVSPAASPAASSTAGTAPAVRPCAEARAPGSREAPPSLELHLRPLPDEGGGAIGVKQVFTAGAAELSSLGSALRPPSALRQPVEVRVRFERAGCAATNDAPAPERRVLRAEPGSLLSLGATPETPAGPLRVELEYQLDLSATALLDTRHLLAEGRQLFFLPAPGDQASRETLVAIDASAFGSDGRAVSSIGLGAERRAPMTLAAIDDAVFAAGYLGSAVFLAPEGRDEAAWFGSPLFDLRPLAAEIASFRSAVRERLNDRWDTPLTTILSVEMGLPTFDVRRAPASVVVRVTPGQTLSAELRLSILHQVLKEWIGGRLTLVDDGGVEAVWFTEGLCRYLARQLAFEFGLIAPLEWLDELNGLLAIQSVLGAPEHAAACDAERALPGGPFSSCRDLLALARGALLSGELDRLLAAQRHSLAALLAGWLRDAQTPLEPSVWAAALERDAGEPATALLAAFARGAPIVPPSSAFGACFARAPRRLAESELGFDYRFDAAAPAGARWLATRVSAESPAFAAGLRADTPLAAIDFAPYAAERPIRLLPAGGEPLEVRPHTHSVASVAWKRVVGVPDKRCLDAIAARAQGAPDVKRPGGMRTSE